MDEINLINDEPNEENMALAMQETEYEIEKLLWKIEKLLEPHEIALIRWLAGYPSYTTKDKNVNSNLSD